MNELQKDIQNGHMLKNKGSWLYCNQCNKTVGYLCYSTYQKFRFEFLCKCGSSGSFTLGYKTKKEIKKSERSLHIVKNRMCCPNDDAPLFTVVRKHIKNCSYSVVCNKCYTIFNGNAPI